MLLKKSKKKKKEQYKKEKRKKKITKREEIHGGSMILKRINKAKSCWCVKRLIKLPNLWQSYLKKEGIHKCSRTEREQ